MEITKETKELLDEAKELGWMQGKTDLADVAFHAYKLLKLYGALTTRSYKAVRPAEQLWNALRKINPGLEIPVYLDRFQEQVDEARMEASSIMQEQAR